MEKAVIIGCGNIAGGYDRNSNEHDYWSHVKAYKANKSVQVVAVYDSNQAVATDFINFWDIEKSYSSIEQMLLQVQPDIVSICSPNKFHYEQVKLCADAGVKTILCEKPLALGLDKVKDVINYCENRNASLIVNYLRSWDTCFINLGKDLVQNAKNELESIHVHYNKGVFHNASHFIHYLSQYLGEIKNISVIKKEKTENDALADFILSFENCEKVYFFNHRNAHMLISELVFFYREKRLKVEKGGLRFITKDYHTEQDHIAEGSINQCMKFVIDDIVCQTIQKQQPQAWYSIMNHAVKTTEICEKIVYS